MKKLALAASLATVAIAGLAYAADAPMGGNLMDRPAMNQTVARADALARAGQMFDRMDANRDGKLDLADREARRTAAFDRIDANKDGAISRAEFTAMRPQGGMGRESMRHGGMRHEGMNHGGMNQGARMGHGMHGRGKMAGMMLRMADSDRDGAVTRAEFTAAATARFDRMDSNHDGQLTSAERQAARAAMHEAMQRNRSAGSAAGSAN